MLNLLKTKHYDEFFGFSQAVWNQFPKGFSIFIKAKFGKNQGTRNFASSWY